MQFAGDFTGDGWADVLIAFRDQRRPLRCTSTRRAKSRRWDKHLGDSAPTRARSACCTDIDGDGKPEVVYMAQGFVRYAKPDPANPTGAVDRPHGLRTPVTARRTASAPATSTATAARTSSTPTAGGSSRPAGTSERRGPIIREAFGRYGPQRHRAAASWPCTTSTAIELERRRHRPQAARLRAGVVRAEDATRRARSRSSAHDHGRLLDEERRRRRPSPSCTDRRSRDVDGDGIPDFIAGKRYWAHRDDYLDPDPYGAAGALLVSHGAQSESAGRRGVRAGVDPQPLRRGLAMFSPSTSTRTAAWTS